MRHTDISVSFMQAFYVTVTVGKFSPLEMVVMEYYWAHFATDKLNIATLMRPRFDLGATPCDQVWPEIS